MHIILVIVGGLVQLGLFLLFGWLWGANTASMALAAKCFVPLWCLIAAVNMWIGVSHAGYSVQEELPILALNIAVPVALALLAVWRLSATTAA